LVLKHSAHLSVGVFQFDDQIFGARMIEMQIDHDIHGNRRKPTGDDRTAVAAAIFGQLGEVVAVEVFGEPVGNAPASFIPGIGAEARKSRTAGDFQTARGF
jgi:hypothetical protein